MYYYATFNAPCVGHKDDESRAQMSLRTELVWHFNVLKLIRTATPDTTQTGLFCRVWCDGVNWVGPTARQVRSVSGLCRNVSGGAVRPLDALRHRMHLTGGRVDSIHTAWHDTDSTVLSCLAGCVNWTLWFRVRIIRVGRRLELRPVAMVIFVGAGNGGSRLGPGGGTGPSKSWLA